MNRPWLVSAVLPAVAAVHLLPLLGVLGTQRLQQLYGLHIEETNLLLLMRRVGFSNGLFPSPRHPEDNRTGAEHTARHAEICLWMQPEIYWALTAQPKRRFSLAPPTGYQNRLGCIRRPRKPWDAAHSSGNQEARLTAA